ncbi:MAG: hypothetical protein K8F24_00115, partial [Bacteroidales bacterium]|nr:hypothetical protein [Bacteroidales bacterium]
MHNFKQATILGLILVFSNILLGQAPFVEQIQLNIDNDKLTVSAFKAVSFKFSKQLEDRLEVEIAGKLFRLSTDEHIGEEDGFLMSRLFVFDDWQHELQLKGLNKNDTIIGYLIASSPIRLPTISSKNNRG